jgi:hypothetical protein
VTALLRAALAGLRWFGPPSGGLAVYPAPTTVICAERTLSCWMRTCRIVSARARARAVLFGHAVGGSLLVVPVIVTLWLGLPTSHAADESPWVASAEDPLRTPVDRGGPIPNLAGGPAGPATRETLDCCRRA